MREIKFRAWDKNRKSMYVGKEINSIYHTGILMILRDRRDFMLMPESYELMQFTGLKDKNGVEIWESDILKYADVTSDAWIILKEKTIGIVKWHETLPILRPQEIKKNHKGGHYWAYWDQIKDVKVIGNIHENPELLEAN